MKTTVDFIGKNKINKSLVFWLLTLAIGLTIFPAYSQKNKNNQDGSFNDTLAVTKLLIHEIRKDLNRKPENDSITEKWYGKLCTVYYRVDKSHELYQIISMIFGDINFDSLNDAIATIEYYTGGNRPEFTHHYVERTAEGYKVKAVLPLFGYRYVDVGSIKDGLLELRGKAWTNDDPMCCPSIIKDFKGKLVSEVFELVNETSENNSTKEVAPEFQQLLNLVVDTNIAIPSSLYSLIGIKPEREEGELISLIPIHKLNNTDFVLVVREGLGCTPIICQCMVYLVLFRNGNVISKYNFPLSFEEEEYTLLYDILFIAQVTKWEYDSDENDIQTRTSAPPAITQEYAVILNDKISSLKDLGKEDLRLCRNLIFARNGYRFKDKNLGDYFSTYEWYKPSYDNVDDRLTDYDKKLIKVIRELETQTL